ncbi:MAG: pyridoxal-phosphate dependent enzyme [Promethearchaeota archaeon]|nr:MAG: pyridoxal-phosphate dependent enzyme [Candidatus Lokiarchaeota archaeon]
MSKTRRNPILFEYYPDLEADIPWISLNLLKSPVKRLMNLQDYLGINSLWIKQDDLISDIYGGNKPRKLEFILADAIKNGFNKVLTVGGIGSNHCVATAAFCNNLNLESYAILVYQPITLYVRNNLLLELHFKNHLIYTHTQRGMRFKVRWKLKKDKNIYYIGPGGSTPLGTLGFVNAALEMKDQINNGEMPEPDYLFVANGSMGTTAGLTLGIKIAKLKTIIYAIRVTAPNFGNFENTKYLASESRALLAKYDPSIPSLSFKHLIVDGNYYGEAYGKPTREGLEAIKLLKETESITLEPTYTGKTFAGLIDYVRTKKNKLKNKKILFWNTYNSNDFSDIISKMDYHNLPKELHWVFQKQI